MILYYDLATRDGRKCIEVREASELGDGQLYASAKKTVYSCAYDTQLGRVVAFRRATSNFTIASYIDGKNYRSALQ